MQIDIDQLVQEGEVLRNQLFEQSQQIEFLNAELHERDQAITEIEHSLITGKQKIASDTQVSSPRS